MQSLRSPPTLPRPYQKSRNLWGLSTGASNTPAPIPPTPVVPAQQPEIPTSASETLVKTVASEDLTSNPLSDSLIPSDVPLPVLEIPPLNYGDLAALGFAHWTPAGLCQWAMELIQVSTGMPWFWTIVTATLATRLIILPFNINGLRMTARLAPYQPRLAELKTQLSATSLTKDPIAVQRISLQQKQIYEKAKVSMIQPLLVPFIQLPLSLGMFFGIKKLCSLPLEQLTVGGFGFLQDLTVADPTYMLPLAMAVLINVQLTVGAKDMTTDASQTLHLFNILKVVSLISIPFMANLPAGVMVYLITGVLSMTAQSFIFQMPVVRKAFDIPVVSSKMRIKPPTFLETVRFSLDWLQKRSSSAEAKDKGLVKRKRS